MVHAMFIYVQLSQEAKIMQKACIWWENKFYAKVYEWYAPLKVLRFVQSLKCYLMYVGKHLQVISKKNNNILASYICYGFLNCLYWSQIFLQNFVKCLQCYKCLSGSTIS